MINPPAAPAARGGTRHHAAPGRQDLAIAGKAPRTRPGGSPFRAWWGPPLRPTASLRACASYFRFTPDAGIIAALRRTDVPGVNELAVVGNRRKKCRLEAGGTAAGSEPLDRFGHGRGSWDACSGHFRARGWDAPTVASYLVPKPRRAFVRNRSGQRQITVLALPAARMISAVPQPSAVVLAERVFADCCGSPPLLRARRRRRRQTELRAAGCTIPIQRSDLYTAPHFVIRVQ